MDGSTWSGETWESLVVRSILRNSIVYQVEECIVVLPVQRPKKIANTTNNVPNIFLVQITKKDEPAQVCYLLAIPSITF